MTAKRSGWHRKRNTPAERARTAQYASPEHRAMRRALKVTVDAGRAICCRCRWPIAPGTAWHADHDDSRAGYLGAAHARCNLRAAAIKGARKRNGPPEATAVRL